MKPSSENRIATEKATAKVVVGARVYPEFKMNLLNDSKKSGLPFSEYLELLLMNRHNQIADTEKLKLQLAEKDKRLEDALLKNKSLQTQITEMKKKENNILSDPRLLSHFEKVKGMSDEIKDPYGESFSIKYNSIRDVLVALIYSTKIKKR